MGTQTELHQTCDTVMVSSRCVFLITVNHITWAYLYNPGLKRDFWVWTCRMALFLAGICMDWESILHSLESMAHSARWNNFGRNEEGELIPLQQRRAGGNSRVETIGRSDVCAPPSNARRLPMVVLMVMKITCVFHHTDVTGDRTCYRCKMERHSGKGSKRDHLLKCITEELMCQWYQDRDRTLTLYDERCEEQDRRTRKVCTLCNCMWWNYDGAVERYSDKNKGLSSWNHPGSWFVSFAVMVGAVVYILWDFLSYISSIWGDPTQVIHIFNYGEFMFLIALYPVCNLCSKIQSVLDGRSAGLSWTTALNSRFIVKRLQFIGFWRRGIPGKALYAFLFVLPTLIAALRGYIYIDQTKRLCFRNGLTVVCCGAIMWITANFQYLVYLMRLSFQRQFYLISVYLRTHYRDLDSCRQIMGNAIQDYNCFRKYISLFMILYAPLITWSITTQLVWVYLVHDALCPGQNNAQAEKIILYVALVSWSNILFSLAAILWSVGGIDVNYIIDDFRRTIATAEEIIGTPKNWQRLLRFCDDVTHVPKYGVNKATLFSVIGFFMALRLDHRQSVFYFESITCNDTVMNSTQPPGFSL